VYYERSCQLFPRFSILTAASAADDDGCIRVSFFFFCSNSAAVEVSDITSPYYDIYGRRQDFSQGRVRDCEWWYVGTKVQK